jgi:type VI secretion system secreted protein Hcp
MATTAPGVLATGKPGLIDIFAKITGTAQGVIKGEAQDQKHKGEIQVHSFIWDVMQPIDKTSGLAGGKRNYSPFVFVMATQTASAHLIQAAITGEHLKEVLITCRKAGKEQQEYLVYKLQTCMVSKFESGYLFDNAAIPHDRVSIVFRKFECSVRSQNPDGTLGGPVMVADELGVH